MPFGGTVKLTGESEYRKALKDITQQLKEVASESKAVSSQYSAQDKSEKALLDQSKALNKQLETQKERIDLMKQRYDELSKSEGVSAEQLSKLRTQINNAQADANKTERQIKELGESTKEAGNKFSGLGEKLGSFAKAAGVALAAVGTAAVAAGKKLFDMAKETADAGDAIDKNSQKVGLSAESYQKWDYAMKIAGTEMSSCTTGLKTLTNTFDDATNGSQGAIDKFERLGLSMDEIKDLSREDLFAKVVESLQNVESETEKAAIANDLFGKSGQDLIPLFNMTSDELNGLMQEAEDYGMIMSNEAVANSAAFKDSLTQLNGTMEGMKNRMVADLLPALTDITSGFAGLLAGVEGSEAQISAGVEALAETITKTMPVVIETISSVLQAILKEAPDIFKNLAKSLLDSLPDIIPVISDAVAGIGKAVIELVPEILKALPDLVGGLMEGTLTILEGLWDAILETFFGIENEAEKVTQRINDQNQAIIDHANALKEINPQLADYNKLLTDSGRTLADIDSEIQTNEDAITEVIRTALQEQRGLRDEDLLSIQQYNENIIKLQAERMELYRGQQISALRRLQLETENVTQEGAAQHLANTQEALAQANKATEDAYTAQLTIIEQKYQAMGQVGSKAYETEMQAAKRTHDAQLRENQGYYQQAISLLQTHAKQWVGMDADRWKTLSDQMAHYNMETDNEVRKSQLTAQEWARGFKVEAENYSAALANIDRDSARAFLNMATSVKASGQDLDDETKALAKNMLQSFDNLPDDMDAAGKQALSGMIIGLEDQIPALKNASQMSANEIVDEIKAYLGIHSPSTVLAEVGENAIKGLENGLEKESSNAKSVSDKAVVAFISPFKTAYNDMYTAGVNMGSGIWSGFSSQEWSLTYNVRSMMQRIVGSAKREMRINSPSKVWAEIGDYMAQGLDQGFTDEMKYVQKDIASAMPTSLDSIGYKGSSGSVSSGDNMVDAFKKALSEMRIELDDESVGAFVDKTVTQLVYT